MLRVVLDTNVILSGLIKPAGVPGQIVTAWRNGAFRLVLSEFLWLLGAAPPPPQHPARR